MTDAQQREAASVAWLMRLYQGKVNDFNHKVNSEQSIDCASDIRQLPDVRSAVFIYMTLR
jgi:hypothetical protein